MQRDLSERVYNFNTLNCYEEVIRRVGKGFVVSGWSKCHLGCWDIIVPRYFMLLLSIALLPLPLPFVNKTLCCLNVLQDTFVTRRELNNTGILIVTSAFLLSGGWLNPVCHSSLFWWCFREWRDIIQSKTNPAKTCRNLLVQLCEEIIPAFVPKSRVELWQPNLPVALRTVISAVQVLWLLLRFPGAREEPAIWNQILMLPSLSNRCLV